MKLVVLSALPFTLLATSKALNIPSSNFTARGTGSSKSVIIQLFEWSWDSVAAECTSFIGPNGYGFVQGLSRLFLLSLDSDQPHPPML